MISSIGDDNGDSRPFFVEETMRLCVVVDEALLATLGTLPIDEKPTTTALLSAVSSRTLKTPPDTIESGSVMYCWVPSAE